MLQPVEGEVEWGDILEDDECETEHNQVELQLPNHLWQDKQNVLCPDPTASPEQPVPRVGVDPQLHFCKNSHS